MKTRQLALIGTVLAVASLSVPFIISETSPKPEILKTPNLELMGELVELGCTEPSINHVFRYSSLLDDSFDGTYFIDAIGYPEDLSQVEFDNCVKIILEERISNVSSFGPAESQGLEPCKDIGEGQIDLEPDLSPCYIKDSKNTGTPMMLNENFGG